MKSARSILTTSAVAVALLATIVTSNPANAATAVKCPAAKVNVNTATSAELMTVPGITKKWVKEIQEYRPYPNFVKLEQKLTKYFPLKSVKAVEACFSLK